MAEIDGIAGLSFSRAAADGTTLHLAEAGPADGPLVFLLHGFPEFWYGWRHQLGPLAAAGFRILAPDQRGYNLSDKPRDVGAYDLDRATADVLALADRLGRRRFSVVGHDWGAAVGWWLATRFPDRLERLAALNAPHPAVWREAMRSDPAQRRKSRYVQFFRLPYLPELLLRRRDFAALRQGLATASRPDAFGEADLARYRAAWSVPGALTGMLNWYRALLRTELPPSSACRIAVPSLVIWGLEDAYAERKLADASLGLCERGRLVALERASHWVQHDEPERVGALLLEFLRT
ncbi:MAG: alpha/beta fold hydrolase [Stellaceae bacterium]